MLYVEPVYVKSNQQDAYPLLQKVLVSYGDGGSYVVLANNISDGIKQLVEKGKRAGRPAPRRPTRAAPRRPLTPRPVAPPQPAFTGELAQAADRVQSAIAEVKAAQTSGDFERYGRALKALDEAMTAFQRAQEAAASRHAQRQPGRVIPALALAVTERLTPARPVARKTRSGLAGHGRFALSGSVRYG